MVVLFKRCVPTQWAYWVYLLSVPTGVYQESTCIGCFGLNTIRATRLQFHQCVPLFGDRYVDINFAAFFRKCCSRPNQYSHRSTSSNGWFWSDSEMILSSTVRTGGYCATLWIIILLIKRSCSLSICRYLRSLLSLLQIMLRFQF